MNLVKALSDLQEQAALDIAKQRLDKNENPDNILADAREGMTIVGSRFADGEYFIPDLIYSGEILKQITDIIKPRLSQSAAARKQGKIVLGTVAGDIHDIGLNIVEFMLDTNGFEVYNLGVDVPNDKFVAKIKETGAPVLALSGFLTLAFDSMKNTVEAVKTADLRNSVKIMIGGGQIDDQVRNYTGADAYGKDAMAAVALARQWIGG